MKKFIYRSLSTLAWIVLFLGILTTGIWASEPGVNGFTAFMLGFIGSFMGFVILYAGSIIVEAASIYIDNNTPEETYKGFDII